jgi:hypothetical protein
LLRSERRKRKDRIGYAILVSVLVLGTCFGAFYRQWTHRQKPDPFNCIGEVTRKTAIVLDQTDPVTAQTKNEVISRVMKHVTENVQVNEKVSIFGITRSSKRALIPLFTACRPKSEGNGLTERDKDIKRKFRDHFMKPLEDALQIPDSTSEESPIAQALIDLSLSDFLRGETGSLILVSDMMENTDKFSLYKCTSASEAIRRFRNSRVGSQERPLFKNLDVAVHIIPTDRGQRNVIECRAAFWNWFFGDDTGVRASVSMDYLPGYGGK